MKNPQITQEEVGLIKDAKAGNISAFNKLFYRYKKFVDSILFYYLKDMDEAKDITNIVFLKVYNNLSKFSDYSSFGGWLRVLTIRTAIDYLRSIKNNLRLTDDPASRLLSQSSISSNEDDLVNRLAYERILEEFNKFPEKTKKILELFYVNNMTVVQISKALSVPTGTIKSILSRTRKQIKKSFNN